jgi:hypothetical protein
MKKVTTILSIAVVLFGLQTSNAQFLKKLKDKVNKKIDKVEQRIENKIENKVDEKIDKALDGTIDGIFEESNTTPDYSGSSDDSSKAETSANTGNSGTINFDHGQKYGNVEINTLSNLRIERTNDGYNFYANWSSHEVDIFDGYKLEIETAENLKLGETYTFNISKNASLSLGYDPMLPAGKGGRGVTDEYQNYDLDSGLVKVKINEDKSFEIDFSGQAQFVKRTRDANNEVSESYYTSSVMGNVEGENARFIDNKTISKSAEESNPVASILNRSSSGNSAQAKSSYVFTHETVIEMTSSESKDKYKMSYLLNPNESYMGMKADMSEYSQGEMGGESVIVMDGNDTFIFVDTPGMKMQMSSSAMANQQTNPAEQMENYDYTNLSKTSNTKTILGYSCEEYVMSDNEVSVEFWVAPDLEIGNWFIPNNDILNGHILEYSVNSSDGTMTIKTLDIKENISKTIKPSEYRKMF